MESITGVWKETVGTDEEYHEVKDEVQQTVDNTKNSLNWFQRLIQAINTRSVVGYFYGHKNNYLILGDHYYWYMPFYPDNMAVDLINRTTTDYLEYRDGEYYYKGC